MAPEVVRGEVMPSIQTDLHALAVLLFYLFTLHHPLEGKGETHTESLDMAALTRLFGREPVFIFDPVDDRNRPDPEYHATVLRYWPLLPRFLRQLFTRAFTAGLRDPDHGRVRENQWRAAMARLRDVIVPCPACRAENFWDAPAAPVCWSCGLAVPSPPRITLDAGPVLLNHDARLWPHHVDGSRRYDFSAPVAAVARHPDDAARWGLKNLSAVPWAARLGDGATRTVRPGDTVLLSEGLTIEFGAATGRVTGARV
jgi:hypothetical protein